jgi:hypothetical protein
MPEDDVDAALTMEGAVEGVLGSAENEGTLGMRRGSDDGAILF